MSGVIIGIIAVVVLVVVMIAFLRAFWKDRPKRGDGYESGLGMQGSDHHDAGDHGGGGH